MEGENNEFGEKKDEAKKEIKETIKNDVLSEIRKQPEIARELLEKSSGFEGGGQGPAYPGRFKSLSIDQGPL